MSQAPDDRSKPADGPRTKPARKRKPRRVQRGVLRPYVRVTASGERWWWCVVPGQGRKALGLLEADTTRDEAFKVAVARFGAVLDQSRAQGAEKPLTEIAKAYYVAPHGWTKRSKRTIELRVGSFVAWMVEHGATRPSHLTDAILDQWRKERMAKVARGTINRDETAARVMLRWAASQEPPLCGVTPLAKRAPVREPSRPRHRTIHSPAQVARMVAHAHAEGHLGWALTAAVLESTGWRIDEARRADASWITATGVRLTPEEGPAAEAWTSKGYRVREVELSAEALEIVRRWMAWRDTPHGKQKKAGLSERWFGKVADLAAEALKLPKTCRPHDARRRWVTELVRKGVPIGTVRDLIGHRDVQTTERYVCSYYDDPAAVQVPSVAAVEALAALTSRAAAKVLPMRRQGGKKGSK